MSFASETKNELSKIEPEKKCCMLAEISGFLRVSGSVMLAGFGKFKIKVTTENPAIARHYKKLFQEYFDIDTKLEYGEGVSVKKNKNEKKISYIINIDSDNKSEQILRECGILLIKEGSNYISDGIYQGIVKNKCCKKAYLRGLFLGSGIITDPKKGYDLEYVVSSNALAKDIKKLIGTFTDLEAKVIQRGKKFVCYMKKADYISDMLAIMGADNKVLEFEDIRITKNMKNKAKCQTNCDTANTDRTLDAAQKQIDCITKILNKSGLISLPDTLFEVATLRLENPYLSLEQIGEMCNPPLTKSGVNGRFKKIEKIAKLC